MKDISGKFGGTVVIIDDVTDQRISEEAIRESEKSLVYYSRTCLRGWLTAR